MSGLMESNASNEVTSIDCTSSSWIPDAFDCYQVPLEIGQGVVDPLEEHIQVRHLGPAYIKCGHFSAIQVNFYEVTRSEISEINKVKRHSHCSYSIVGGADVHSDTHNIAGGGDISPCNETESQTGMSETIHPPLPGSIPSSATGGVPSLYLPPKKRKKRTVIHQCVVFSLTKDHQVHQNLSSLSSKGTYYLFPQNSLMDVVNDMAPFQIFCTFHLSRPSPMLQNTWTFYNAGLPLSPSSRSKYRTKLEEFAAVCDSSHHDQVQSQLVDSCSFVTESQPINIEISGASGDAYYSLKQYVSGYRVTCQRMVDLLHLHNQRTTTYKTESSLYSDHYLSFDQQPILSKNHNQGTEYCHHDKTNSKSITLSLPQYQQHDYIDQQQSSLIGTIEKLSENSSKTKTGSYSKKRHSAGGPDNKPEDFDKDYVPPSPTKKKKPKRNSSSRGKESAQGVRKCIYCDATSTPMWRRGPEGAGTLCNACGVKWKHGKILSGNTPPQQTNDPSSSTTSSLAANTSIKDDRYPRSPTSSTLLSQQSIILSSESLYNSPLTSFTSTPDSSPPLSMDSQQHRGLLSLPFTEKLGLDDNDATLPLATGVDDVEAAAVLTLLRQS